MSRRGGNIGWVGPPLSIEVIAGPSSRERENVQTLERHDTNYSLEGILSCPIGPPS